MASVDMTITYDDERGTPADMGETLALLALFADMQPEKIGLDFVLNVGDSEAPIPHAMNVGLMGTLTDLPLGVKSTLKLAVSRDKYGAPEAVGHALRQIGEHEGLLLSKITLSIPVRNEAAADRLIADRLIADLEMHLAERPYSVSVAYDKIVPGSFRHGTFDRRTPIDEAIRKAGAVTLSHTGPGGHQSVTLTRETSERAAELLRRTIAGE